MAAAQDASKILELKQFLTILHREIQAWVRACHPRSPEKAMTLVTLVQDLE